MTKIKYNLSVSEELSDHFVDIQLGDGFHYIKVGATNVNQLELAGILTKKSYGKLKINKPDGVILFGKNDVKVLVEAKPPLGILSSKEAAKALVTDWYYELAKKVGCKVIIVTDNSGGNTYWFDVKGQEIKENGEPVRYSLNVNKEKNNFDMQKLLILIKKCENLDSEGNIIPEKMLNPTNLASRVWQKIWITTGKDPEKCLYNVVEIFIFKFLSDLGVLENTLSFSHIYKLSQERDKVLALEAYTSQIRKRIKYKMFPKGDDGTTIFNGTIFVNEKDEANISQAGLFAEILEEFARYEKEEGSFENIDKQFKTRLYESFLRQSAGVAALGQYFTPRNVVCSVIEMISKDSVKNDIKVCDPFCGVGGFILEFINTFDVIKKQYAPNEKIQTEIIGYDKGSDEKEDERTIILAKANMLIYLADLIKMYKGETEHFAKIFNNTFHLLKDNLGTFKINDKKDYFDLIITNPPYVTSGATTIKKEIKDRGLFSIYPSNGTGLEGLAIEWIVNALKPRGRAFIIVPDGLFTRSSDKTLRDKIIDTCEVNAIISLPSRTFFATPKKTYILAVTKKDGRYAQKNPIFTYLVTEIGETKDAKRFEDPNKNDLVQMSKLYKQFSSSPVDFESINPRCKIQDVTRLQEDTWLVDRDWTAEERKQLDIDEDITEMTEIEFYSLIDDISKFLSNFNKESI